MLEEHCSDLIENYGVKSNEMNEFLFGIYKDSITEEFIEKLSQEVFIDNNEIIGVEKND